MYSAPIAYHSSFSSLFIAKIELPALMLFQFSPLRPKVRARDSIRKFQGTIENPSVQPVRPSNPDTTE